MATPLDEQGVEEEEAWERNTTEKTVRNNVGEICVHINMRRRPVHPFLPVRVSPLSHTPSFKFFLTTFFTSSNAWGSSGVLKHVRCESNKNIVVVKSSWKSPEHFVLDKPVVNFVDSRQLTYLEEVELIIVENPIIV